MHLSLKSTSVNADTGAACFPLDEQPYNEVDQHVNATFPYDSRLDANMFRSINFPNLVFVPK